MSSNIYGDNRVFFDNKMNCNTVGQVDGNAVEFR